MRRRLALVVGSVFLTISVTGCATATAGAGLSTPVVTSESNLTNEPTAAPDSEPAVALDSEAAAAREQAQTWLDAATLPPGAVRSDMKIGGFNSYTGWPCGPIEELEAFWKIPDATVHDTANWLMENPTAGLITTAFGPASDNPAISSAMVGYIPEPDAQEGIVYTIAKTTDGVVVRAEIAALTESAVCPPPPGGGAWGAPGHG